MRFENMFTGQTVVATDWQEQLRVGDCYVIAQDDLTIYGEIMQATKDAGFFWSKGYSVVCPEGEEGLMCVADAHRQISRAEFEAARADLNPAPTAPATIHELIAAAQQARTVRAAEQAKQAEAERAERDAQLIAAFQNRLRESFDGAVIDALDLQYRVDEEREEWPIVIATTTIDDATIEITCEHCAPSWAWRLYQPDPSCRVGARFVYHGAERATEDLLCTIGSILEPENPF